MRRCLLIAVVSVAMLAFCAISSGDDAKALPRAPKPKTGYIGDSLRLRGVDTMLNIVKATVHEKSRIEAVGLLGVRLTVKNVSTFYDEYSDSYPLYEDYLPKSCTLFDTRGVRYRVARKAMDEHGDRLPNQLGTVKLERGENKSGWLYFKVSKSKIPSIFQLRPNYGWGYDTGRWKLGGEVQESD